jgi:hypothetical protein
LRSSGCCGAQHGDDDIEESYSQTEGTSFSFSIKPLASERNCANQTNTLHLQLLCPQSNRRLPRPSAMSAMETDINAPPPPAPAGEGSSAAGPSSSSSRKPNKRFEIKKWNAVALWAWGLHARSSFHPGFPSCRLEFGSNLICCLSRLLPCRYRRR